MIESLITRILHCGDDILGNEDDSGSCVAWSQFFKATLAVHGISSDLKWVTPEDPRAEQILMKNWIFVDHIRTGANKIMDSVPSASDAFIAYDNTKPDQPCILPGEDKILQTNLSGDDTKESGIHKGDEFAYKIKIDVFSGNRIPAQGNLNSSGAYENHYLVKCDGNIYDPSYGKGPYGKQIEYEKDLIDGVADFENPNIIKRSKPYHDKNQELLLFQESLY